MSIYKQAGFTLVELVVVIVLLGLLAATALPRFLNITEQAKTASLEGMLGGFATGVALVRTHWVADGNSNGTAGVAVTVDNGIVYVNENGWPAKTSSASDAGFNDQTALECQEVWNFVLQNPPLATVGTIGNHKIFVSVVSANPNLCRFTLIVNGAADQDRYFDYNLESGQVFLSQSV